MSETVQKISYITLSELSEPASERYFREFCALYTEEFPPGPNAESPDVWRERFERPQPPPQPVLRIVVAVVNGKVAGGMVYEYYRGSRCGLLTYVVVAQEARQNGIARKLTRRAILGLKQAAEESSAIGPVAVFAEAHDPRHGKEAARGFSPVDRLRILHRLRAWWVDIPYVQPPLGSGMERDRKQLLVAFPLDEEDTGPEAEQICEFLREFYRALGIDKPDEDPEFQKMEAALSQDPPRFLKEVPWVEKSCLSFRHAAVCFHFV